MLKLEIQNVPKKSVNLNGGFISDHSKMKNLDFENSGHTGFQKELTENQLKNIEDVKNKVDKEDGKGLSERDFTAAEKEKLAGIEEGANKYILPSDVIHKSDMEALKAVSLPRTERAVMSSLITLTDHAPGEKLLSARVYGTADGVGEVCEDGRYKLSLKICGKNIFNPEQFLACSGWTYTDGVCKGFVSDLYAACGYSTKGFYIPPIGENLRISFTGKNAKQTNYTTCFQIRYPGSYQNIGYMNKTVWTEYSGTTTNSNYNKIICGYNYDDTVYMRDILFCDYRLDNTYEPYIENSATVYIDTPLGEGDYIDFVRGLRVNADGSETDAEITGILTALDSEVNYIWCDNSPAKIEVGYYQDINKVIEELKNAILAQGANV